MRTEEQHHPDATRRMWGHGWVTRAPGAALVVALVAVLVSSCAGSSGSGSTASTGGDASAAPGTTVGFVDRMVDVNGHQVAITCHGSGPKAVVFVSDVGQTGAAGWEQSGVPAAVAPHAVACTFDRPGIGKSDIGSRPRSIDAQVADLDALISSADLPAPLVLVGQGYGTFIARQFAQDHRDAVSGLVLVDPPLWLYAIRPPTGASSGVIDEYASLLEVDRNLGAYGAGALPPPPAPTVVIGIDGTKPDLPPTPVAGASLEGVQSTTTLQPLPAADERNDDQRQLAQKSPFGKYQQLDDAGAVAQYWKPDAITAIVLSVLNSKPIK